MEKVSAALFYSKGSDSINLKFSEDSASPNNQFCMFQNYTFVILQKILAYYGHNQSDWNIPGAIHKDGLKFLNFKKPVYLISSSTADMIVNKVVI